MKKIHFFAAVLALAGLSLTLKTGLQAVDLEGNPPPFLSTQGGGMDDGGFIITGKHSRAVGGVGHLFIATSVSISAGEAVTLTNVAGVLACSKTATAGDILALGVAVTGAAAGSAVQVATHGGDIVYAESAVNTTINMIMVTSATAGKLTNAAGTVTTDSYNAVSQTAFIARALETKTIGSGNTKVLVEILK